MITIFFPLLAVSVDIGPLGLSKSGRIKATRPKLSSLKKVQKESAHNFTKKLEGKRIDK